MKLNRFFVVFLFFTALTFQQCGVYSFTGASLSPDIKTISIDNFYNDSGGGPANLSQLFSEEVRDYYQRNTSLSLVPSNGDLLLEGSITGYQFTPIAPQASGTDATVDRAGQMRLTITVKASYVNTQDDTFDFNNRSFSFFADFDANQDPAAVENQLIDEITEKIILDIFNATVANW